MCGIAGIVKLNARKREPPSTDALERMARAMFHRGPDELGLFRDERVGLAHSRLSIIDLSTGQQPLISVDQRYVIVFNGEIFNYVELREEIEKRAATAGGSSWKFQTKSDTEVLLAAWDAWGTDCFAKFNGQWAIAIWDRKEKRIVFSRDRLGVRPLYLMQHEGALYFGSEVKAIFAADPSIPREIDPLGLDETFTFWSVVAPRTTFRNVEELPPGAFRVIDLSPNGDDQGEPRITEAHYWTPSYEKTFRGSIEDATEAVASALREATRLRMVRADVPVGSYLSGGLDSSYIAALGLKAMGGARFSTYSLRFEDAEYDETEFQRMMAKHIASDHHEVVVSRRDIAASFAEVIYHTERPLLRTAPTPLFLLSRLVRKSGIKVVLTGEGADEMFAGYDLFREARVRRFWAKEPASKSRPLLLQRLYPWLARSPVAQRAVSMQFFGRDLASANKPGFGHTMRWHPAAALKRLFTADLRSRLDGSGDPVDRLLADLPSAFSSWTPLAQDQYLEVRTLLSGYLLSSQGDRMLMANSVEGRFPFLDRDVVELANTLPDSYKLHVLDEKHVLKRAAINEVPREILQRTKQPYRAPDALSFVGPELPEELTDALSERSVQDARIFDPVQAQRLVAKCRDTNAGAGTGKQFSNADNMAFVGMLSTQLLHEKLVRRSPAMPEAKITTRIDMLSRGKE